MARASSSTALAGISDSGNQAAPTHSAESDHSERTSDMSYFLILMNPVLLVVLDYEDFLGNMVRNIVKLFKGSFPI